MKAQTRVMRRIGTSFALALALGVTANARAADGYQLQVLVSDGLVAAKNPTPDPNLINAWGLTFSATSPAWVADNGTGLSTLYDGNGNILSLVVTIPSPSAPTGGTPTGIVANVSTAATSFPVGGAASRFLFSAEDGTILGWSGGTAAIIAVDNSAPPPVGTSALYKGIALSAGGTGQLLYATDFHNGRVDAFKNTFAPATLPAGAFTDPNLPAGYAPFGIQAIGGNIYVTYAKQVPGSNDEAHGKGLGVVDVYDPNGVLLDRVATHGNLNAPWGIAMAPAGFGKFSN
ncbi:MAG TPA: TIGR03118 family protein, partial [Rudaea sp.]|nr:TIGR03118 family protein [Rudaea sp.]